MIPSDRSLFYFKFEIRTGRYLNCWLVSWGRTEGFPPAVIQAKRPRHSQCSGPFSFRLQVPLAFWYRSA